ncbi:hypothetical protein [Sporosarcina ureilytica]|uniref:Uncharacterized protein n=1 Tax=Sporosarcina ureilytica TaxID=298596 RepID=A0A1D8JIE7_9BACL|nr:hypothetical protein [Sporosarcina ureilytica]AOV08492.1 hypothetical protein BI350_13760 [Sporosarcina ureilytica]
MNYGFDQNGKPTMVYGVGEIETASRGLVYVILVLLGIGIVSFVLTLFFALWVAVDLFVYFFLEGLLPLKFWFYFAELDHWIGVWDKSPQKSVFFIAGLAILFFIFYRVWKKRIQPGVVKTIGKIWIGSNLAILAFRLPLYIGLSIYIALVGIDDFHLFKSEKVEYVKRESGFYANHSDATIDTNHSKIFNKKIKEDINGTEYDDYMIVTSGTKPNSEEPGYWTLVSLNLHKKVDEILFIGAFVESMQVDKNNPLSVQIKTGREMEQEKIIFEKTFTDIHQVEEFKVNVKNSELVDIIISSDHEFNFGIFELKKYMSK